MSLTSGSAAPSIVALAFAALLIAACAPAARPAAPSAAAPPQAASAVATSTDPFTAAKGMSLDELHQKALEEGGTLVFYSTLSQNNSVLPTFQQRFPGITVEHVDATGDKLAARLVTEARAGKVLADIFQTSMEYVQQASRQGIFLQDLPPEALAFPADLRGPYWVATYMNFLVPAWNTNLVRPEEAPRQFEDFADPRWKDRLIADARNADLLMALALRKYGNDEQPVEIFRRIAANNPEFHRGHSELAELLVAGHAAACVTCSAHHYPPRIRRGAPVDYLLAEGVGEITANAVLKDAPHPYTAMLWHRWAHTEEGQQAYAEGGRIPAHPNVAPIERTRPERIYALGPDDLANMPKYERLWKEIFQLR